MKNPKKALRLSYELEVIDGAVLAAWTLAEQLRLDQFAEQSHLKVGQMAIASVLALVSVRLKHVEAVLRGDRPLGQLWAPHNDATGQEDDSGSDLMTVVDTPEPEGKP
jgi:hypothetical protein